ncbi:single-stranded-DNA-specific exonuclease RecJ [Patescibacteria group bacterium]|nr:single-stranded-DNA-specific exonuclease RecJ [Patescibacteria group bacterium]
MEWKLKPTPPSGFFKKFPEYSSLTARLLYARGLKTQREIDEFFNSDYEEDIHNPFLLKGMKKAVKRVLQAVEKEEKILIYGDFDADGVCSTAILCLTLKHLGVKKLKIYIPDREKENHGLNKKAIKEFSKEGVNLIITVDCGSTDLKEVSLANSLGMDVIITDHHELRDELPKTVAIINSLQKGDKYPFKKLCGAGIAYKLACALLSSNETFKKWLLDLTAIATVSDVMPIVGENRTLVKYGLGVLAQTKWLGLQELMKVSQIDPLITKPSLNGEAPLTNLDTRTIGFVIGPRLNAASRMDHANSALRLLITKNKREAMELAAQINQNNSARQNLTTKIVQEVEKCILEKEKKGKSSKLIFEGSAEWPVGLVGLIAGKIASKYCRPAFIYHQAGELIHASGRSASQVDLVGVIKQGSDFLDDYGGHKDAAGFRMKKKNLKKAKDFFKKIVEKELKGKELIASLEIDAELSLREMNWQTYDEIQKFTPFGRGNLEPRFSAKGMEISEIRTVGNGDKHLKLSLMMFDSEQKKAKNFKAIAFGLGERGEHLKKGDSVDIVFEFIINEWNGCRELELKVVDIKNTKNL